MTPPITHPFVPMKELPDMCASLINGKRCLWSESAHERSERSATPDWPTECRHGFPIKAGVSCSECEAANLAASEPASAEPAPESDVQRQVIHHMTLMLSDFGRHDPACCCAADQILHAADCKDCECGLADAIKFGVEQSGISLEPEPPTPAEEARLQEIERRAVDKALAEVKTGPAPREDRLGDIARELVGDTMCHCGASQEVAEQRVRAALEAVVRECAQIAEDKFECNAATILARFGLKE